MPLSLEVVGLGIGTVILMFIIAILLFVLMLGGEYQQQFVNGVKHLGNFHNLKFMELTAFGKIHQNVDTSANAAIQNDSDDEVISSTSSDNSEKEITEDKELDCTVEDLICDGSVPNEDTAHIAFQLISEGYEKEESINAAIENGSLDFARMSLQRPSNL